ncbi:MULTISPECIES: MFS transporter [unclassified Brevibacterium]|uniref:MFS transporter n=1 Tax=unclassified Brevibacterium TaxID=2614124 RepID=UPI001092D0AD|nr:MFS transporter [Brevibacterium sp. S22]TGD30486.1 MFS transporter [Brevibacterium sp. S22]
MPGTGEPRSPQAAVGVGLYFTGNGAVFAALLPWYPLLVDRLALSSWQFGLVVACFAVGSLLSSALPAALIARFGAHRVVIGGTVMLGVAASATAWSVNGVMMAVCLLLLGCFDAIVDVAQNVVGISVQERAGRTILSSMHALWSLGGLVSGAAATAAASGGADMRVWMALIGIAAVLITIVGRRLIGGYASPRRVADSDANSETDLESETDSEARGLTDSDSSLDGNGRDRAAGRSKRAILSAALPLAIVAICGAAVEDIANNWAGLAAVDFADVPTASAGIAFSIVIGSQCLGRFSGDLLVTRFGAGRIARLGGGLIALGGIGVVAAWEPVLLLVAMGALGFGSATLVPGALGAAGRLPGLGRAGGVTLVNWLMRVGYLGTSPLVGVVATGAGLRWGLGILVLVGILTMVFAHRLDVRRA